MSGRLPAPDPFEPSGLPPDGQARMPAPAAVFLNGRPSPEVDRTVDAILDSRPGALFVFVRE